MVSKQKNKRRERGGAEARREQFFLMGSFLIADFLIKGFSAISLRPQRALR